MKRGRKKLREDEGRGVSARCMVGGAGVDEGTEVCAGGLESWVPTGESHDCGSFFFVGAVMVALDPVWVRCVGIEVLLGQRFEGGRCGGRGHGGGGGDDSGNDGDGGSRVCGRGAKVEGGRWKTFEFWVCGLECCGQLVPANSPCCAGVGVEIEGSAAVFSRHW